jgi:hypothetical protein
MIELLWGDANKQQTESNKESSNKEESNHNAHKRKPVVPDNEDGLFTKP